MSNKEGKEGRVADTSGGRVGWLEISDRGVSLFEDDWSDCAEPVPAVECKDTSEYQAVSTTDHPKWQEFWPEYVAEVEKCLDRGHREYGDESFGRKPSELISEIMQELTDVTGWAAVMWYRVGVLKERLRGIERTIDEFGRLGGEDVR